MVSEFSVVVVVVEPLKVGRIVTMCAFRMQVGVSTNTTIKYAEVLNEMRVF